MLTTLIFLAAISILGGTIATALRRGGGSSEAEIRELRERLLRLEQSMESMTSDMERVAESQRFMTALLEDRARGQAVPRPLPPAPGDESARS